jgi:Zn-dependent M28 family amino/carboxypeptidase
MPDPARLEADVRALSGERHWRVAPRALAAAEDFVALELSAAGFRVERQLFEWRGVEFHNVVATREGTDPARPLVVVGAHFDSRPLTPGADDNASGVAAMLEVARLLGRGRERLAATVQCVGFNLEELQGLPLQYAIGSRAYARWLKARGARLAGMLNLEMVGFTGPRQSLPFGVRAVRKVPREGTFLGAVGDWKSRGLLAAFERAAAPHLPVIGLAVPLRGWIVPDVRRSDNASLWDAGYPALLLTDTADLRNPHYHRPGDTPDTLDYGFLARTTAAVAAATLALAR